MPAWTLEKTAVVALLLVAAEAVAASVAFRKQITPSAPDLAAFPITVADWHRARDLAVPPATAAQIQADRLLDRIYERGPHGIPVELFVAWYKSQRGAAQPHSPKVCLPGAGWLPVAASVIMLSTGAGAIPVNQYTVTNRGRIAEVLYWYQTPRRVVASEWAAKVFTVFDDLRDWRTDTAVIRIVAAGGAASAGAKEATLFAKAIYPELRDTLPK